MNQANKHKKKRQIVVLLAAAAALFLVWAELAVGVFGTPFAGT
jgi:hypothetical protein